jgi:hypothetical protein
MSKYGIFIAHPSQDEYFPLTICNSLVAILYINSEELNVAKSIRKILVKTIEYNLAHIKATSSEKLIH